MKWFGLISIALMCFWAGTRLHAQDVHFSQIDVNPTLFNPAYSGFFDGKGRVGINYRSQWFTVTEPYQTFSATAEASVLRSKRHKLGINLGLYAYVDRAGSLSYGTTAGDVTLSMYHGFSRRGDNLISLALSMGCGQSGFDQSNAVMTDQESFDKNTVFFKNISAGVAFFHQFGDASFVKLGLSGQHLNRPNISYMRLDDTYLERKYNAYMRFHFEVADMVALMPVVALQMQKNYSEFIIGADAKYYYDNTLNRQLNFIGGLMLRYGDAIIVDLGAEYNSFTFSLNYDANISKLASASYTVGALEVGMIYKFAPSPRQRVKSISCPVF